MVVTSLPTARDTGATQERIASPSRWTVQAPHCAMPQPYFVPVRPRFSRKTQSRGVEESTSRFTLCLFTLKEIIGTPPLVIDVADANVARAQRQLRYTQTSLPSENPVAHALSFLITSKRFGHAFVIDWGP